jgi:hypothetical protein
LSPFAPGAAVKSLTNKFRFRAPPAGTGTITFKALTKVGPANVGEFYRTNDLVLQEGAATPAASSSWVVGAPGQTCDDTCTGTGSSKQCDEQALRDGLDSPSSFAKATSRAYPCVGPPIIECESEERRLATTAAASIRRCWYEDASCNADGSNNINNDNNMCARNSSSDLRRFCPCKNGRRRRLGGNSDKGSGVRLVDDDDDDDEYAARAARDDLRKKVAAAWEPTTATGVHGSSPLEGTTMPRVEGATYLHNPLTGATVMVRDEKKHDDGDQDHHNENDQAQWEDDRGAGQRTTSAALPFLLPLLLLLFFTLGGADGHNWLGTPRRGFSAGTPSIAVEAPCSARRPHDIHYQVGRNQPVAIKFSAGHSSRFDFITLPGAECVPSSFFFVLCPFLFFRRLAKLFLSFFCTPIPPPPPLTSPSTSSGITA